MCNQPTATSHQTKDSKQLLGGLVDQVQHMRTAIEHIGKPFLGFHRTENTGVFVLTYAFTVNAKGTETVLQHLRFDVKFLLDGTYDLTIADKENNVLHEQSFVNALEVRDFMDSLLFVEAIPTKDEPQPVDLINLAEKNDYAGHKDALFALLEEQGKTPLTVYLSLGGIVIDRHEDYLKSLKHTH